MEKGQFISRFRVPQSADAHRLDLFLSQVCPTYSRSYFKKLIESHLVKVNNEIITKAGFGVRTEDIVEFTMPVLPEGKKDISALVGIKIIHEHEHFLIINKPAGLVVHKAHTHDTEPNLVDWLLATIPSLSHVGLPERPGIVHRLDKDTSGLMIVARTNYGHSLLSNLFKNRAMHKTYRALVEGHPPSTGTIDLPIGRDPVHKHKMTTFNTKTDYKNRSAISHYQVITYFDNYSLIEIKPVTGRTHQIRVHMASIGHPLLGDKTYNTNKTELIDRQALHASALTFVFDNESFSFTTPVADDFDRTVSTLKIFENR